MSLSKLGLPGSRCGIIIANEKIITAITNMNGIISLSPGGIGPAMMCEMIKRKDLLRLSNDVIKPFYYQRVQGDDRDTSSLFAGRTLPYPQTGRGHFPVAVV